MATRELRERLLKYNEEIATKGAGTLASRAF